MKTFAPILTRTILFALFLLVATEGWAAAGTPQGGGTRPYGSVRLLGGAPVSLSPTLARLSFRVPPSRMAEFETAYEAKVIPILKAHGLVESAERGRATPDSIFSRLFEVWTPVEVIDRQKALQDDSTWTAALQGLGKTFGTARSDGLVEYGFSLYASPAGPGRVVVSSGRQTPAGRGTGHWRTFDASDGLIQTIVQSVFQDREGNLWFGTRGGVSRYDGKTFTNFTTREGLVDNRVNAIFQDREGSLWFGTWGGVSRYDGKTFTNFTVKDGLPNSWVWSILQDREGYLWFGSNGGATRYDGRAFTTFTPKDGLGGKEVRSIFQDREGHLWFGAYGGGVSRYDGRSWITLTTRDGLPNNRVHSIFQDQEGNLWVGTDGGVSRYDGKTFTTFTTKDGLVSDVVFSMWQDREGIFWFGTVSGLSRYDGKSFATQETLPGDTVWSLFEDREGHLWVGTWGGVSRYDGKTFTSFTTKDGLVSNVVSSMFQDREGYLWFGTWGGVCRYDGKTFTSFAAGDGLPDNKVKAMSRSAFQDRDGHLWFGIEGGVSRYDGKTWRIFTKGDGLAANDVRSIFQDREGVLWFSTVGGGASRYDGKTFTTFNTFDGLASDVVLSIFQDREGSLWFGTEGGASRYDGKAFTNLTTKDGLISNRVYSIFQDREGSLWFGTWGSGVSRYDGKVFTNFTAKDGLTDDWVSSIVQDREGHLWFGTSGGLTRYDGRTFQTVLQQDGLTSNSVGVILQDREGSLWFGTTKGVTRYRRPAPSPPPVFIDAVIADRRYSGKRGVAFSSSVSLTAFEFHGISLKTRPGGLIYRYRLKGYDRDWITTRTQRVEYQDLPRGIYTFEVVAVDRDLVYSEKSATVTLRVHLPYMLVGLWSALGIALVLITYQAGRIIQRDRRLSAANLALREKTEALQETNVKLDESNRALSDANRALFELNAELKEANRQVQEATERKSRFLASMSHELRTPMNAIIGFTNLVLRRAGDALPERQRDNLTKVKLSADHLLALINDILDLSKIEAGRLDVRPVQFEVRTLITSCCATVSPLVKPGVTLSHQIVDGVGEAHTDEAKLRQVVINLLSNALKFTEQGEVKVRVARPPTADRRPPSSIPGPPSSVVGRPSEDGFLEIAVSDTGVGIPPDALGYIFEEFRQVEGGHQQQKGTGLGLPITKKLTELLGGTIEVSSEVGKGSVFRVRVPLVYQER